MLEEHLQLRLQHYIFLKLAASCCRMDWIPQLCTFNGQKKWTTMNFIWRVLRGKTSTLSMSGGEWMSFLQQLVLVLQFDNKIIAVEAHRIVSARACYRSDSRSLVTTPLVAFKQRYISLVWLGRHTTRCWRA